MDWSKIVKALESNEIPLTNEETRLSTIDCLTNAQRISSGKNKKPSLRSDEDDNEEYIDPMYSMPIVLPGILELNFENRNSNPAKVLRILSELYPEKNFQDLKIYLHISMALANHYVTCYRKFYDRLTEERQQGYKPALREIENYRDEMQKKFDTWVVGSLKFDAHKFVREYYPYLNTVVLSTDLSTLLYQAIRQSDIEGYKKIFKYHPFTEKLQSHLNY